MFGRASTVVGQFRHGHADSGISALWRRRMPLAQCRPGFPLDESVAAHETPAIMSIEIQLQVAELPVEHAAHDLGLRAALLVNPAADLSHVTSFGER
jgi:hypothetical protein